MLGTDTDGSALGLPIVRGIGQLHRATVEIIANPRERGSIARMSFPLAESAPATLRSAA